MAQAQSALNRCRRGPIFRDCVETIPKSPQPPIMGEHEGNEGGIASSIRLPHYWGPGGLLGFLYSFSDVCGEVKHFEKPQSV